MNSNKKKVFFLSNIKLFAAFVLAFISILSIAQDASTFNLKVKFSVDGGGMENALITITKNGSPYKVIDSKAKYKLELDLNAEYLLVFTKMGYITKSLAVDTHVPNGREKEEIQEYIATVELAKQPEDQVITYTQPVGRIKYSTLISEFDADKDYTQNAQEMVKKAEANPTPKPKPPVPVPRIETKPPPPPPPVPVSKPVPVEVKKPEYKPEPPKPKPVVIEPEAPAKPLVKNKVEKLIQEDKKRITIITVNIDGVDYVYKMEEYNWGGIYFYKDGKNITERTFAKETE